MCGAGALGERRGRLGEPSSLGVADRFPEPRRPVQGGRGLPWGGVWHLGVRTPNNVSTLPLGQCPGPVVRGFAAGTQPMGRNWGVLRVWCGLVWCAEGAATRRQWLGCLPTGTVKREGCVCCVRAVCKCVVLGRKEREPGEPGCHPPDCLV